MYLKYCNTDMHIFPNWNYVDITAVYILQNWHEMFSKTEKS